MAHIVSFRIDGLAGRKEPLDLKLNRDTNIFFGLNGSGKTSLLKILHSAMSGETENLTNVPFTAAIVSIYSMTWDKVFTRSIKMNKPARTTRRKKGSPARSDTSVSSEIINKEQPTRDGNLEWSCSPSSPRDAASTRWNHEYLPTTRLHVGDSNYFAVSNHPYSRHMELTEDHLDSFFAAHISQSWRQYSAQVSRDVRTAQEQGLVSILRAVLSTTNSKRKTFKGKLTPEKAYERVEKFLERQRSATILETPKLFAKRFHDQPILQDVVQIIDSVEDKIESAMTSRNKLQELIERMFTKSKKIKFTDECIEFKTLAGETIGLASLSSGEKHLVRIFVQSLLANENSMMVDEPELSMHVDWQRDLIHSLRALNSKAQFIFATHSPEVLADVPDKNIFRI